MRVLLATAAATALLGPGEAQAAKTIKCTGGKVAWTLGGRQTCAKPLVAKAPAGIAPPAQALVARGLRLTAAEPAKGKPSRVPRKLRTLLRKRSAALGAFAGRAQLAAEAKRPAGTRAARTVVAQLPAQTYEGDGVRATVTGSVSDDGTTTMGMEATVGTGSNSATVGVEITSPSYIAGTLCPTAAGAVGPATSRESMAMSTRVGSGAATKVKITNVDVSTGQVGPDGVLKSVTTSRTQEVEVRAQGVTTRITYTATASGAPGQTGSVTQAPTVKVKASAPGYSEAAHRAYEQEIASSDAIANRGAQSAADGAARANDLITRQRANWESLDANKCVQIAWSPDVVAKMAPSSTLGVTGTQLPKAGGAAIPATWTVGSVTRGSFGGGAGGAFTATSGPYQESAYAVVANRVIAASPAGRVARDWSADYIPPVLPKRFELSFSVVQSAMHSGQGLAETFAGSASYAREGDVVTEPDGVQHAAYPATRAALSRYHYTQQSGICRYEADLRDVGSLSAGSDVELVKAADGTPSYGFTVYVDLPPFDAALTEGPPDGCGASTGTMTGQRVVLQARKAPDSSLYAAPGALAADGSFHDSKQSERGTLGDMPGVEEISADWEITGTP